MTPAIRHQGLHRNWVSFAGGMLASGGAGLFALALLMHFSLKSPGPYFGIFTFILFPGLVLVGLATYVVGMMLETLRRKRTGSTTARPYPMLDLNDERQRLLFQIAFAVGVVLAIGFAFAGYNGFLLTESVPFCGKTCHTQMNPEMTAYLRSTHARVPCVACHVGDGAGAYVQSKMNGANQLLGVILKNYDRPIPTPVKGLRPARETCENCHWPQKNWGSQLYQRPHFRYDEKSTPEQISMLMRVGGGQGAYGSGIHWHMAVRNEVTYIANDTHLQDIPWVSVKRPDGSVTTYARTEKPLDPAKVEKMAKRTMDCIDCHSRPAHDFETPDLAVDKALSAGVISPTLPFVKSLAVETLTAEYETSDEAHDKMPKAITAFYAQKYPDVAGGRASDVAALGRSLIDIYDRNVFPDMKITWGTYPSNLGHRNSAGCFRCHDGKHATAEGKVLASDCNVCHTEPRRGPQTGMGEAMPTTAGESDWHPWQTPEDHLKVAKHKNIQCHECHMNGRKPKTQCNECHSH